MDGELVWKAMHMAFDAHDGQKYGEHQYSYHLSKVASSVAEAGYDDDTICVAYLHDILEDTEVMEQQLGEEFSANIVNAVRAITKVAGEAPYEYLDKVSKNKIALAVKMHDTLCNLQESLKTGQMGRVKKYSAQLNKLASY